MIVGVSIVEVESRPMSYKYFVFARVCVCVCVGIDIDVDADVHIVFQDNTQCVSHQKCCCDLDLLDCVCVCSAFSLVCFALLCVVLFSLCFSEVQLLVSPVHQFTACHFIQ
jgi:hypothetical protein